MRERIPQDPFSLSSSFFFVLCVLLAFLPPFFKQQKKRKEKRRKKNSSRKKSFVFRFAFFVHKKTENKKKCLFISFLPPELFPSIFFFIHLSPSFNFIQTRKKTFFYLFFGFRCWFQKKRASKKSDLKRRSSRKDIEISSSSSHPSIQERSPPQTRSIRFATRMPAIAWRTFVFHKFIFLRMNWVISIFFL